KWLNIHPKLLNFFWMIFTFNVIISVATQYNKSFDSGLYWFANLLFPVWISIVGAFPIGLLIAMIPQEEKDLTLRLIRSQVFGVMIVTFILFVFYLYGLMANQPVG